MIKVVIVSLATTLALTACVTETTDDGASTVKHQTPIMETIVRDAELPVVEPEIIEPMYNIVINEEDVIHLAKMSWGEARGCSDMEVAATMWCVLNRVDKSGDSIIEVITAPNQFTGYGEWCPVEDRFYNLAVDVLTRWQMEKQGATAEEVGRVLPAEYLFFHGEGGRNHFRDSFTNGNIWDWNCTNPYETERN